jgi:hypothetical protein
VVNSGKPMELEYDRFTSEIAYALFIVCECEPYW